MNSDGVNLPVLGEIQISAAVAAKATEFLDQRRICLGPPGSNWAICFGFNGRYLVRCFTKGCSCTCPNGRVMGSACSHIAASLIAWQEGHGALVEFPPEVGDQLELLVAS